MWLGFIAVDGKSRKRRPSVCYLFHTETTEGRPCRFRISQSLAKLLAQFLACLPIVSPASGSALLLVYVRGLLSNVQREERGGHRAGSERAPRTLQRFLESIVWDEQRLRDRCQQMVATRARHPEADRLHRRNGNGQERQRDGRCETSVQRQSRQDRELRQQRRAGVFHARISLPAGRPLVSSAGMGRRPGAPKKTTFPTTSSFRRNRRSRWT